MNDFSLTDKQKQLFAGWKHGRLKRINILEGSVRSGKTYSSLILWAMWLAAHPENGRYLMAGRTLTSLRRNCLEPLNELLGEAHMRFSTAAKRAVIFGRNVDLEGAANTLSENKIRGLTLTGAYLDEITLLPREFFVMLLSRLSVQGAQLFGTTNPDSPGHWLKTEFLDRRDELELYRLRFLLEDNTALPPEYIRSLKREYTGVFFDRFIRGDWVAAEGAVYPMFDPDAHVSENVPALSGEWIGVDYGHTNPTCFLRLGVGEGRVWVVDEYYHRADKTGAKSPRDYARDLSAFAGDAPGPVVIDPSAEGFILQLKEDAPQLRIRRADNAVSAGIQLTGSALSAGLLRIHPRCKNLIRELSGYRWDPKAQLAGQDKPIKHDDHACDALRYALMARRRDINRRVMNFENPQPLPPDPLALARL